MKHYDYSPLAASSINDNEMVNGGAVVAFVTGVVAAYGVSAFRAPVEVSGCFFFVGLIGAAFAYEPVMKRLMRYDKRVQAFATRNRLAPATVTLPDVPDAVIRQGAEGVRIEHAYGLQLADDTPCTVYEYAYSDGPGSSAHRYNLSIVHCTVDAKLPQLFLDSTKGSSISSKYQRAQRISLEGDFDRYFNLYAVDDGHVDALSIISPDVMQLLVDEGGRYDIAINGHDIYVIFSDRIYTQRDLPPALEFANRLHGELQHRSVSWQKPLQEGALKPDFWRTQRGIMTAIVLGLVALAVISGLQSLILG